MKYLLIIAISLLVIGCGNDLGRYEVVELRGSTTYLLDTKTGSVWEYEKVNDSYTYHWVRYIEPIEPKK
jgi:hypothetical protein